MRSPGSYEVLEDVVGKKDERPLESFGQVLYCNTPAGQLWIRPLTKLRRVV
jgi:hypothetical protein